MAHDRTRSAARTAARLCAGSALLAMAAVATAQTPPSAGEDNDTCSRELGIPEAPPGGFGPACSYFVARGTDREGRPGYHIGTILAHYAHGVLVDVKTFTRFEADADFEKLDPEALARARQDR